MSYILCQGEKSASVLLGRQVAIINCHLALGGLLQDNGRLLVLRAETVDLTVLVHVMHLRFSGAPTQGG